MRTYFLKSIMVAGVLASAAYAGSPLVEKAPLVGIPASYAIRYSAYMNVGYDDNLHGSTHNKKEGGFVRFGASAAYADYESVTRLSYNVRAGAQLYEKDAHGTKDQLFSDIQAEVAFQHRFGASSVYDSSLRLSYQPDQDYSNPSSSVAVQGEVLHWNWQNSYSSILDERWLWHAVLGVSGFTYSESDYRYDNRYYVNGSLGISYVMSERTSVGAEAMVRHEMREYGYDSDSFYFTGNIKHVLSPVSSCYLSAGVQMKMIDDKTDLYPHISASYRRELSDGLSVRVYLSHDNENVDSYNHYSRQNYLSNETWRAGATFDYAYTPVVTFFWGGSVVDSEHSKGTQGMRTVDRQTWNVHVGMRYAFTENLIGTVRYSHTSSDGSTGDYDRNAVSTGVRYNF